MKTQLWHYSQSQLWCFDSGNYSCVNNVRLMIKHGISAIPYAHTLNISSAFTAVGSSVQQFPWYHICSRNVAFMPITIWVQSWLPIKLGKEKLFERSPVRISLMVPWEEEGPEILQYTISDSHSTYSGSLPINRTLKPPLRMHQFISRVSYWSILTYNITFNYKQVQPRVFHYQVQATSCASPLLWLLLVITGCPLSSLRRMKNKMILKCSCSTDHSPPSSERVVALFAESKRRHKPTTDTKELHLQISSRPTSQDRTRNIWVRFGKGSQFPKTLVSIISSCMELHYGAFWL